MNFMGRFPMHIKSTRGFTLIEMLIVIVIIGVLASALVPRLISVQARARDTRRKTDFRNIYNANEIYLADNGKYRILPGLENQNGWVYSTAGIGRLPGLTGILTSAPLDPLNTAAGGGPWDGGNNYMYAYGDTLSTPKNTYDLAALLENPQDPDRCGVKFYKIRYTPSTIAGWCNQFGYSNQLYDPSPDSQ